MAFMYRLTKYQYVLSDVYIIASDVCTFLNVVRSMTHVLALGMFEICVDVYQ